MQYTLVILITLVGGVAVALQAVTMGTVTRKFTVMENFFLTYLVGFVFSAFFYVVYRIVQNFLRTDQLLISEFVKGVFELRWWEAMGGGLYGVVIVGTIGYGVSHLGALATLVIILFSQLITGAIVDHYGLLGARTIPVTPSKMVALGLIGLAVILMTRK